MNLTKERGSSKASLTEILREGEEKQKKYSGKRREKDGKGEKKEYL